MRLPSEAQEEVRWRFDGCGREEAVGYGPSAESELVDPAN
jgi:hypothetical protein